MSKTAEATFVGDVGAATDAAVNTKGGSLTATLKKPIRDQLGEIGEQLAAATVNLAGGQTLVLLGAVAAGAVIRVSRINATRFQVEVDTGEEEDVDEMTAAFLRVKVAQFKAGQLAVSPTTVDDWRLRAAGRKRPAGARALEG